MMRSIYAVLAIVQLLCIRESCALPGGAPLTACVSLIPRHGSPLAGTTPFQIGVRQVSTDELQVTISSSGNTTFQGFILQAREVGTTTPLGRFVNIPALTHTISCGSGQDTVTHNSTSLKTTLQFTWIPPVNFSGTTRFYATVAIDYSSYWRGIISEEIILPLSNGTLASPGVSKATQTLLQPSTTIFLSQMTATNESLAKTPSISETLQQQATFSVLVKDSAGNSQTASQVSLSRVTDIDGGLLLSTTIEQLFHSVTMPVSPSAMVQESSPVVNQIETSQVRSETDRILLVSTFIQLKQTLSKMLKDTTPVVLSSTSQPSQLQPELTMSQVGSSVLPSETVQQQSVSATNEAQTSAILEDSSPAPQTSPLLSPFLPQFTSALLEASQTISETAQQPSFSFQAEVSSSNMVKESTPVGEVFFTLGSKSSQQLLQPSITQASASSIVLPSPFPKTRSLSQPASVPQLPSSAETLPVAELSSLAQSSPIAQTPPVSQTPTLVELPSVAQTPHESQSLSLVESPMVAQTPSESQPPTLVDLPSVAQTLLASQSPSLVELSSIAQSPSVSPVESSLVVQTPSAFQSLTLAQSQSVAILPSLSQSPQLVESTSIDQSLSTNISIPFSPSISQITSIPVPSSSSQLSSMSSIMDMSPVTRQSSLSLQSSSVNQTLATTKPLQTTVNQSGSVVVGPTLSQSTLIVQLTVNQTGSIAPTQKEILPSTSQMVLTTTQPPTQGTVNTIVSFSIMRDFDQKLEDKMSREYRELTNTIEKEVENVYRNDGIEVDVTVRSLRRGSIIAVLLIVFQNQTQLPDSPLQLLKAAITDNKLGNLSVDPNSFSLRFDECDTKCHQNATCAKSTTSVSFSCKCNPGLTGNGVQCTEIKEEKKDDDDDKEIKDLLIASIVIVSVILLVVLLMFMCLLCRICKNK